jgi:hypothetical protein
VSKLQPEKNDSDRLREALLDQLRYFVEEVDHLASMLGGIPESVFEARPHPDSRSIKELYGRIAYYDEAIRLPGIRRMVEEDNPNLSTSDAGDAEAWNDLPMKDLLIRLKSARLQLVAGVEALFPADWSRRARWDEVDLDVYGVVHAMIQQDVDWLRTISYRLYGVRIPSRS